MPGHEKSRRSFLKGTMLTAGAAFVAQGPAVGVASSGSRKPNVVLVMTDDQGYGDLGCLGNPILETPHLDGLHAESVRFTDFHVCPTCAPTRASLMTGRYCNRTGVWHTIMGRSLLRRDEVTMADVFAGSGYRTGIFGKWHLGDNYPFRPQDKGFHEVLVHGGGGVGQTPDFWGNDYFDDTYWHNGQPEKFSGYCTDVWFDGALDFVEANKDRPFFCYVPTNAPHSPYNVDEKYAAPYRRDDVAKPEFFGMIANIDENMGRLLGKLTELGLDENTIFIFMTDNGTSSGVALGKGGSVTKGFNAGMRGKKGAAHDGGHRVPCFVRWPAGGLGGGRDIGRLTAHVDLLPTLIGLCGLDAPENVDFDGDSLVALLEGDNTDWPARTLVVDSQRIEHPEKWRQSAVMTDRWRLVNGKELHDVKADPGQRTNVATAHPDVVAELRAAYEAWWNGTSARFGEYCEIVLGSDSENPARLTCHDWHCDKVPWNQGKISQGPEANGFWAVDIERDGTYAFDLRRWPEELDAPITSRVPGGKAVRATHARLCVGDHDVTQPIPEDACAARFEVPLKAGKTRLQTWFTDGKRKSRGAYFVSVTRLEKRQS